MKTQECDVLIAIGMRFSDRITGVPSKYAPQAKIIHLDIDKAEIDKVIKTDVAVVGDCKQSLPAITRLLEQECSPRVERFLRGIPPAGTGKGNREGYPS